MMRTFAMVAVFGVVLLSQGCASRAPAPVDDRRPAATAQPRLPVLQPAPVPGAAAAAPRTYVIKRGDTLYSIALEHGSDYRELAQLNQIDDPSKIRIGQELRLSAPEERPAALVGAARVPREIEARPLDASTPPGQQAAQGSMKTSPTASRLPYSEQNLAALSRTDIRTDVKPEARPEAKPEPVKPVLERDPEAIEFAWPARGRVLQAFAEPNSKGVDIGGRIGDPVVAAAQGRVMYTGTGIRGYGKLIVIKHDNNFNSVYAHNREILVKEGQSVARGQRIAELGDTDADTPKLHFEIRKSGKPVDPARYLPPS